ncbi:MAG: WecB/TagA/CpsF family glycosyltransferase [Spirochaetota bacterium]|nr:WecB/TagA/CpsF family glycosyltransferase [Spirochaetota bacterium]
MQIKLGSIQKLTICDPVNLIKNILEALKNKSFYNVIELNLSLYIKTCYNKELRNIVNQANLVLPKGKLFIWGLKLLFPSKKNPKTEDCNDFSFDELDNGDLDSKSLDFFSKNTCEKLDIHKNTRLSLTLMRYFEKRKVGFFLLGSTLENVNLAARNIKSSFPSIKILGVHSALQIRNNPADLLEKLKKVSPQILFFDISNSKHEKWLYNNKLYLGHSVCIGMHNEIKMYAGKEGKLSSRIAQLLNGGWLFIFQATYFLILILMFKTIYRKEVQCQE